MPNNVKMPKVTVLMSVYNGEKYLREAINSILNQTFKDFEFLIINDGSTDRTAEILQSYQDSRIKITNNEKNIGLTKSLNKGLKMAKSEYIARMDADDRSFPKRLGEEVELLDTNPKVGLVGTCYEITDEDDKSFGIAKCPITDKEIRRRLLEGNAFGHGSVMFRRECIDNIGSYRPEFRYGQDFDLFLRISEKYGVANISEPLYKFRISLNSLQKKVEQDRYASLARELAKQRMRLGKDKLQIGDRREIDEVLKEMHSISWIERRKVTAQTYYFWGTRLFYERDHERARRWITKALFYNPFSIDAWRLLAFTFSSPTTIDKIRKVKWAIRKRPKI